MARTPRDRSSRLAGDVAPAVREALGVTV
jgi:hypothetical protein